MLLQFLYLPTKVQQRLTAGIIRHQVVRHASETIQAMQPTDVSVPNLVRVLEGVLPVC